MVGCSGSPNWRLFDKQQYLTDTVIAYYKLMSTLEKGKRGTGRTLDKLHHSVNFRISCLYFFTVESALDLENVEGKSFKSGLTLVGRWFQWLSASNICNEKRIKLLEERVPYKIAQNSTKTLETKSGVLLPGPWWQAPTTFCPISTRDRASASSRC